MKPINQAERRKAFLNFLLFFIITIGVIVLLIFFSIQVPFKENANWRNKIAQVENERLFQQSFNNKMEEAMKLIDSMNVTQADPINDNKINNKLNEMASMLNDSVSVKVLYTNIVQSLQDLQRVKQSLRNAYAQTDDADETKQKMAAIQQELIKCQTAYSQQNLIIQQLQNR